MRRILIDHARRRGAQSRQGKRERVPLSVVDLAEEADPQSILAVEDAILRLEAEDARLGRVVRLRFYAGLSIDETARALDLSRRTVHRDWTYARAWLYDALREEILKTLRRHHVPPCVFDCLCFLRPPRFSSPLRAEALRPKRKSVMM